MSAKWQIVPVVLTRDFLLDDLAPAFTDRLDKDALRKRVDNPFSGDNWADPTAEDWCE